MRRTITLIAVLACIVAAALPGTAGAAAPVRITGVSYQPARMPAAGFDSVSPKTARAYCPPGKRVLGGGAYVFTEGEPLRGRVTLHSLIPGETAYVATAAEWGGGWTGRWAMYAYAVCADDLPALELELVSSTSLVPPRDLFNDATAACPAGKDVIGTGGVVGGSPGAVAFQQIRPNQNGDYVFVQAAGAGNFRPMAIAVCARPVQGWRVEIDGTDYQTDRYQRATADCAGRRVVAGGLTKGDDRGRALLRTMHLLSDGTLQVAAEVPDQYPAYAWNLAAWAVCVDR